VQAWANTIFMLWLVKALTRLLISRERKHFKIRFAVLYPLTATLAICFENLTPLFMVSSRSTNSCTVDKTQFSTEYATSGEWWRSRIQHLLYEIGNWQVCDHSTIRFISSYNECGLVQTLEHNLTSSAKIFTRVFQLYPQQNDAMRKAVRMKCVEKINTYWY